MPEGRQRYFNNDGSVCAGGRLYTYDAGTSNPRPTYANEAGTVANTNPVQLDAKGEAVVYWSGAYKVDLKQADGTQVTGYPVDNLKTDPAGIWGVFTTLAAALGATLLGFILPYANAVRRTIAAKLYERPTLDDFGGVGDGATDCTSALLYAIAAGVKRLHIPTGRYVLNKANAADLAITGMANMEITGDGPGSVLMLYGKNLAIKGPSHVAFKALRFEGNPANTDATGQPTSVWLSNFTDVAFDDCEFANFGGLNSYPDGTVCLYLYAGPDSSKAQAGSSEGARVTNCRFYGNSRHTNFGLRIFTEWGAGASLAYSNSGAIVSGCTFGGFNWNALEVAGPMTTNVVVANCVGNLNGLAPFDIDKGASNCLIKNVTINRLLGNIDTNVSQSTRSCVVGIQGETNVGRIAQNNHVEGVVANLLAADINAFAGFGGYCGVGYSNAKNCSVKNVKINIDVVPTKNAVAGWAFAAVCFESISGCETDHITVVNGTHGIMETAANIAGVGSNWNEFRKIRNIGTMKGECIWIGKNSQQTFKHKFEDIKFATDMTVWAYDVPAINLISSAASPAIVSLDRVYVSTAGYTVLNPSMTNIALREVYADFAANNNHVNFFTGGNTLGNLHYGGGVYFNGKPLDVYAAFGTSGAPRIPAASFINTDYVPEFAGSPVNGGGGVIIYATAAPTNPPAANWAVPTVLENLLPSAGGYLNWVNYGGFWKTANPISP